MKMRVRGLMLAAGVMGAGFSGFCHAQEDEIQALRRELEQLRKEVAELKANQPDPAAIEAAARERAAENTSVLAGIDEKGKLFFRSTDGAFTANLSGQLQFRYIWNNLDDASGRSGSVSGFQTRRIKLGISGEMYDNWGYKLVLATDRNSGPGGGNTFTEDAYITYDFDGRWENWSLLAGTGKLPFARQEIISSTRQVAVDRALATEFFTLNRSDQFTVKYGNDNIKAALALSDGGNADFTGFGADNSNDFALTGRVDWQALGEDWVAMKQEFGGVENDALFFGAAVHYEAADGGGVAPPAAVADHGLAWTADALYKTGPVGLSAAVFGNHTSNVAAADTDQYGLYLQGDYDLGNDWDVFSRWEWIDDDGVSAAGADAIHAVTVGANHHFNQRVKFTGDVVWVYEGDALTADGNFINGGSLSSGLGLSSTGFGAGTSHGDQVAVRLQLQLLF